MLDIRLERRTGGAAVVRLLVVPLSLLTALCVGGVMLALDGKPPIGGLFIFLQGAVGDAAALTDTTLKAAPIFLCAVGLAPAFRMGVWNIGAEGQFALGAVGATAPILLAPHLPAPVMIPLSAGSALVCGALWALIPAALKVGLRVNEIVATLMLNYVGILALDFFVYGPWRDPSGFPMSPEFPPAALVGDIPGLRLHWGLPLCLLIGAGIRFFIHGTRLGYEIRVGGQSKTAARYAGIPYDKLVYPVLALGGMTAALAGWLETTAVAGRLQPGIMVGYGYTAIVVAWMAGLDAGAAFAVAFLIAAIEVGADNLQLEMGVPAALGQTIEGVILLIVLSGGFFVRYKPVFRLPPPDSDFAGDDQCAPAIGRKQS